MDPSADPRPPARLPAGRHGLPPEAVAANQRERLLLAMTAVVAERGYVAATVADVLQRSGVSRRTFYEQFADKEACFLEALAMGATVLHREVRDAYAGPGEWGERAARAVCALLRTMSEHPAFARTCIVEVLAAGPEALERYGEAISSFLPFLEEGRAAGDLPPDLPAFVTGGIVHLLYGRIVADRTAELPAEAPVFVQLALGPFVGVREAARLAAACDPET